MNFIIFFAFLISFVLAILSGNTKEYTEVLLSESASAVTLCINICGSICFWSGIMKVAESSGIVKKIAKLLFLPISLIFKGIDKNGKAIGYITLNIISNLLGLANASTPLGIMAMQELYKEEGCQGVATDNMVMLCVINSASLQLFPATVAAMRTAYGSDNPLVILPAVWVVSILAFAVSVTVAKILSKTFPYKKAVEK